MSPQELNEMIEAHNMMHEQPSRPTRGELARRAEQVNELMEQRRGERR